MLLYLMVASYKIQRYEVDTLKWCIIAGGIFAAILAIKDFRSLGAAARATIQIGDRAAGLNGLPFDLLLPALDDSQAGWIGEGLK